MAEPHPAETIGQRLRRLRHARGMSQRDLASPGVSYAYISRIEAGSRQPSVKALRMLARKLGVSADYLETGFDIGDAERRELRIAEAELQLRLGESPDEAEQTLHQLMREATTAGDQPAAARIRVALGLVAATAGRHDEAVQLLEDALASPCPPRPATHPEAFSTLGQSYAVLGRVDQAVELFERCLEETREQDEVVALRFRLYLSCALGDIGEFGRAEEVVSEALDHGERFADPITYVHLNWSVARLAALQGNHAVALEHVRRAIALLEATEDTLQLGRAHLLCGFIMNMQRDGARAESHLAEAKRLLEQRGDAQDLVSLKTEQAKAAAQLGRADEAIGLAQEVLDRLGKDDPAEQGGAWSALAQGYAAKGEIDSAEESFRRALGLLGKHTRWREAEQAALRWAELLEGHDRPREAAELRARANEFGSRATSTATAPAGR